MRYKWFKLIVLIIVVFTILTLGFGCKKEVVTTETTIVGPKTTETTVVETSAVGEPVELILWWWGEQELKGLEDWLNGTIAVFENEHPNVKVSATLQATENVLSDFPTASAAGEPPDLQFLWDGTYCMDWAWLGYIEPLNNYFTEEELDSMYATPASTFEGKVYRVGWWHFINGWTYNIKILKEAGVLDNMIPPKTWDEWLEVCQKVKDAGYIPISLGTKDKLVGDNMQALFMVQQLDSYGDILKLCTGELRWDDPRYYEHWVKIKELWDKGYINDDANSLDLYQGQEVFARGESAFTYLTGCITPSMQEALGVENVGFMVTPQFGIGKFNKSSTYTEGIGMSSGSKYKELAAEFIRTIHREDRVNAFYAETRGLPADKGFDSSLIGDPIDKYQYETLQTSDGGYLGDVIPYVITDAAACTGIQLLFTGESSPEDLGKEAQRVSDEWQAQNPDIVEKYLKWMK